GPSSGRWVSKCSRTPRERAAPGSREPSSPDRRALPGMERFLQQLINGISLGSIYALIALGYTMVYGVLRLINFAHGDVYMLGAYAGLFASGWFGVNKVLEGGGAPSFFSVALIFLSAMVICAIVGVLIERFAYRPLRNSPRLAAL